MSAPSPWWHGLWRKARLIKDWDEISKGTGAALSSQELFFNVCFAVIMGGLRVRFQGDHDFIFFSQRFLGVWALITGAADYATRFNDEDLYHKFWWTGYGTGLVGLVMHMKGGAEQDLMFHAAASFTNLWIALAFFRVGATIPRCRIFSLYFGFCMVVGAFAWQVDAARSLGLPAMISPIASTFFVYVIPTQHDVPMSIEYHVAKFTGIKMLLLGQPVVALAVSPAGAAVDHGIYVLAFISLVLVLSIKLLIFDCDVVPVHDHAIRQSKGKALLWLHLCEPVLAVGITATAAGVGGLMDARNKALQSATGVATRAPAQLLSLAAASLVAALLLTQWLHRHAYSSAAAASLMAGAAALAAWSRVSSSLEAALAVPCLVLAALVLVLLVDKAKQAAAPANPDSNANKRD